MWSIISVYSSSLPWNLENLKFKGLMVEKNADIHSRLIHDDWNHSIDL